MSYLDSSRLCPNCSSYKTVLRHDWKGKIQRACWDCRSFTGTPPNEFDKE